MVEESDQTECTGWSEFLMRRNGNCSYCCDIFNITFSKFSFGKNIRMSKCLASDKVGCSVEPDVCPNYLAKSSDRQQMTKLPISSKRVNMYNNSLPTGNLACCLSSADFFSKSAFFDKFFQEYHQCQTVWIQIRPDLLTARIWVQTVYKHDQQTTVCWA